MSPIPLTLGVEERRLCVGDRTLLRLEAGWSAVEDPTGAGVFLRMNAAEPASHVVQTLGAVEGLRRFTSLHRYSPYRTRPAIDCCDGHRLAFSHDTATGRSSAALPVGGRRALELRRG